MRVLIADDNRDAADTLGMLLRLLGHEVRTAYDGFSALAIARYFKPRFALLDIQMPGMNGGELALHLRQQSGLEGIRIAALSASDPHDPRLARYDGAFDAFLAKPCDLDSLAELLAGRHSALPTSGRPSFSDAS
ncbi:MAG TPA: response regulator [Gemmataceae bacterium]|nr:response regulator [Gemmataceae bacterium]